MIPPVTKKTCGTSGGGFLLRNMSIGNVLFRDDISGHFYHPEVEPEHSFQFGYLRVGDHSSMDDLDTFGGSTFLDVRLPQWAW